MHVQTCGMRILSFAGSLYQDDGTVLKNVIILPDCWTEYLHSINQSINQSIKQSSNQSRTKTQRINYNGRPTYRYTGFLHRAVFRRKGPSGLARDMNECPHKANYVRPLW